MTERCAVALPDESATEALAARVAESLAHERGPLCITLSGALGSGKTTWVRALLRALGVRGTVRSPSFTLVEEYAVSGWEALHLDLYRLGEGDGLESLGVRERFEGRTLVLVEWPGRAAPGALPTADLAIELLASENGHRLEAFASSSAGERLLAAAVQKRPDESSLSSENG